ncbi:MAG: PLP-dependent aminotransferase family protein [Acidobacteriota bacterium]|nr:PLP-dependent aminotransferase family protein [Acidobacteriota bacterium]
MINLKLNYPTVEQEVFILRDYLKGLSNKDLTGLFSFPPYRGTKETLETAAGWLKLTREISNIVLCNSANHALSCVLGALRTNHTTVLAEPFTYPAFKTLALRCGYQLRSCDFDDDGLTVEGIEEATSETDSKLLYLQPTIHNPACAVMSVERRRQIADFARAKNLLLIEDDAYRFLHPNPPPSFLDLIPERTVHIASLSKPFNPLVKTAFLAIPTRLTDRIVDWVRTTSSGNSSLLGDFANYILQENLLQEVINAKQALALERQKIAENVFERHSYRTYPPCFHLWLKLPENIKASQIAAQAHAENVSISIGADFALDALEMGERFIRLSLGAERKVRKLEEGLQKVADLLSQ